MWQWMAEQCRPLDFFILAVVIYNSWRIRFLVKWIQGGQCDGKKAEKKGS